MNSSGASAFQRAKQVLDDTAKPESWLWDQDGDEIVGEFVREDVVDLNGTARRVVVLRTEDGRKRSVWVDFYSILEERYDQVAPAAGQVVAMRRGKRRESLKTPGQSYYPFEVVAVDGEPIRDVIPDLSGERPPSEGEVISRDEFGY
jgi:hypothetical protein